MLLGIYKDGSPAWFGIYQKLGSWLALVGAMGGYVQEMLETNTMNDITMHMQTKSTPSTHSGGWLPF